MTRAGNFSSSGIYKLMTNGKGEHGFGAPTLTYIKEKRMELRLGRQLTSETNARPTLWGTLMELYVFHVIGIKYKLKHKDRFSHPTVKHWTGCPDVVSEEMVGDIKCPYTLKSFCETVDSFTSIESFKETKPDYYWQLVSNSILTGCPQAELIVFVPYLSELKDVRKWKDESDVVLSNGLDMNKFAWIDYAHDDDLPYLVEGGYYDNINTFQFDVPKEDAEQLTERVKLAVELLTKKP